MYSQGVPVAKERWVNPDTGEVADGFFTIRGAKYPKGVEFMTMFRDGWKYLATLSLAPTTSKVLFELLARLDYENWLSISQETLAEEIGMRQPHVARAIKDLVAGSIIEVSKDGTDKRRNAYRLNANLGWKGDAKQWMQHQHQRAAAAGSNVIPMPGVARPTSPKKTSAPKKTSDQAEREALEAAGQQHLF